MTLLEKVNNSLNTQAFTMYKEGLFYKCYNEDAMVFSQRVKNYKVTAKFVKSVGAEKQLEYNSTTKDILVKIIQEFDLANSTPMQGLVFIQELKNHIKTQD